MWPTGGVKSQCEESVCRLLQPTVTEATLLLRSGIGKWSAKRRKGGSKCVSVTMYLWEHEWGEWGVHLYPVAIWVPSCTIVPTSFPAPPYSLIADGVGDVAVAALDDGICFDWLIQPTTKVMDYQIQRWSSAKPGSPISNTCSWVVEVNITKPNRTSSNISNLMHR